MTEEKGIKIKGQWVEWDKVTIIEIKTQLALGTLNRHELKCLFREHAFNNEVTGYVYKLLYKKQMKFNGKDPAKRYLFE